MSVLADHDALARAAWRVRPDTLARRLSVGQHATPPHVRLLGHLLYLAARGSIPRLAVSLPPGHSKSENVSHWFPVWLLDHRPDTRLILTSYEATFAGEWGKKVRQTVEEHREELRVVLRADSQAANRWRTTTGHGGMWTAGAGGAITGRRARVFIIDDPHKNSEEAHSEVVREKIWRWFRSTARTRLLPGGAVVIVATRWHEDDLIGKVMAHDRTRDPAVGTGWVHVRLPAVAEQDETIGSVIGAETVARLAAAGIPLPEWRRDAGEPLWPTLFGERWFDEAELAEIRFEVGEYEWAGLYQQRPAPLEGELFKRVAWQRVDAAPAGLTLVRRWDLAATAKGDWTAGVLMGLAADGRVFVLDVRRDRLSPAGVKQLVAATAEDDRDRHGGRVLIRIEQEGGSSGVGVADDYMHGVLSGYPVKFEGSTGPKFVRALPFAAQQEAGNVHLVRVLVDGAYRVPGWWGPFIDEHSSFPSGAHDDQVDAASLAFSDLAALRRSRRRARVGVPSR